MNDLTITSSRADAAAFEAVEQHHAQLSGALNARVAAVSTAATAELLDEARQALVVWCEAELMPHARAEEQVLYPAGLANPATRMLVEAMVAEHGVIAGLVEDLRGATSPVAAAGNARALQVLFGAHVRKENEQLFPVLVADPAVSMADLLETMHQLLSPSDRTAPTEATVDNETSAHSCGCGEHDPAGYPELDARVIPHAIRHSTIFGALASVAPGGGLVLVAPHDPLPLLSQIEAREPGVFEVSYLEEGPEAWRLAFVRRAS